VHLIVGTRGIPVDLNTFRFAFPIFSVTAFMRPPDPNHWQIGGRPLGTLPVNAPLSVVLPSSFGSPLPPPPHSVVSCPPVVFAYFRPPLRRLRLVMSTPPLMPTILPPFFNVESPPVFDKHPPLQNRASRVPAVPLIGFDFLSFLVPYLRQLPLYYLAAHPPLPDFFLSFFRQLTILLFVGIFPPPSRNQSSLALP